MARVHYHPLIVEITTKIISIGLLVGHHQTKTRSTYMLTVEIVGLITVQLRSIYLVLQISGKNFRISKLIKINSKN